MEKWSDYYYNSKLSSDELMKYDNQIREAQKKLLKLLECIDNICNQNNIKYSLHAGTLLGAIRHGGFIPWDDDADIAMLREDFDLFYKVFNENSNGRYLIEREELWVWRLKEINGIKDNNAQIDIFIIDNTPSNTMLFRFQLIILKMLQGMLKNKIHCEDKSIFENTLQLITYSIGKAIKYETKIRWYDLISKLGNRQKSHSNNVFISNEQYRYIGNTLKSKSVKKFIKIEFNNLNLSIMDGWEECLTKWYGEGYMELPPVEKRIPEHTIKLDIK